MFGSLLSPVLAQDAAAASSAPTATTQSQQRAAIEQVLTLLQDETSRAALIKELQSLQQSLGAAPSAAPAPVVIPSPEATPASDAAETPEAAATGLAGAVDQWLHALGQRLPTATLGAPIDVKVGQAAAQLETRITSGIDTGQLQAFLLWAVPGLLLILAAGLLARLLVRRAKSKPGEAWWRALLRSLVPVILLIVIHIGLLLLAATYATWFGSEGGQDQTFVVLALPFLMAPMFANLLSQLLTLLVPSRGARLVRYAQIKLWPWAFTLMLLGTMSTLFRDLSVRRLVGFSTADIASLLLDLTLTVLSLIFVLRHRLTIRNLIMRGAAFGAAKSHSFLGGFLGKLARIWHILAIGFILLNLTARIFGLGGTSFIPQMFKSIIPVVLGIVITGIIEGRLEALSTRNTRLRRSLRRDLILRLLHPARILSLVLVTATMFVWICSIWGFDLWRWMNGVEGSAVVASATGLVLSLAVAWLLWTVLDVWIENTLTPTDSSGRDRMKSGRVQTLLPLLRNFVLIVLIALTGVVILANLGVNVTPLIAGAGVFGLALSFGSQQLVQDVITGLFILIEDTIAIGDTVNTGDRSGVVEALTIRTMKIRDADGSLHSIPFSTVKAIKNSSRNFSVFSPTLTIANTVDPDVVIAAMRKVVQDMRADPAFANIILGPLNNLGIDQINPGNIIIKGSLRTRPLRQADISREFNRRIMPELSDHAITI